MIKCFCVSPVLFQSPYYKGKSDITVNKWLDKSRINVVKFSGPLSLEGP